MSAEARRHPELVSGSISPLNPLVCVTRWMLKQVQHDAVWSNPLIRRLIKTLWALGKYLAAIFSNADAVLKLRAQ